MSEVLVMQNVSKFFGNKKVVNDVSLTVSEGEIFGFIGPNGAGKTTAIKMILGLLHIDQGQISIAGHDVVKDFETAMKYASGIIESPDMYKGFTGYQNLVMYARASGASKEKISEVIELVGMQMHMDEKMSKYSLGMRQRLGVAQALLSDPKIMILDEPTNGLDPAGIKSFRMLLKNLAHTTGLAVLVSSHILQEMQELCDTVGIIHNGSIRYMGTMQGVQERAGHTGTTYRFVTRPKEKAIQLVRQYFPNNISDIANDHIDLFLTEEAVPNVNRMFFDNGVNIFGLSAMGSSLEESFMEITGGGIVVE